MKLYRAHLPGSPARNGLPEPRFYTYQGCGSDTMPLTDKQLEPYAVDYSQWLPSFERGSNRMPREDACECGYKPGSANCRALHRSRLEAVAAEVAEYYGASR